MSQVIIGLAGHIDHGKTSLIKALTGVNTDSTKEEIDRGMTIDIGFAFLNDNITLIDVPGHEKFLRNMITGVANIDLALVVIAADDSVMPQTREHIEILNLLGVKRGCIVVNKIDSVENEWLELVHLEINDLIKDTFLENSSIINVSATTNKNISYLKDHLINSSKSLPPKTDSGLFRMPVDRVFMKKGFGTVVTGAVLSGELSVGQEIEILPQKIKSKVRSIQSHDKNIDKVKLGDRAAINLQGVEKSIICRGSQIVKTNSFIKTKQIAAVISLLEIDKIVLKHNQRIRINVGTQEVIGRILFINTKYISNKRKHISLIKLETYVTATMHDRFIIRTFSPIITIGGGYVVDNQLEGRWKKISDYLNDLYNDKNGIQYQKIIEKYETNPISIEKSILKFGISSKLLMEKFVDTKKICLIDYKNNKWLVTSNQLLKIKKIISSFLKDFHQNNPHSRGVSKEEIRQVLKSNEGFTDYILNEMLQSKDILKDKSFWFLKDHKIEISGELKSKTNFLIKFLEERKFVSVSSKELLEILKVDFKKFKILLDILINTNKIIKIDDDIIITRSYYEEIIFSIKDFFNKNSVMSVTDFKNIIGFSRKYAVPLLEFLDKNKITYRIDNNRKLSKIDNDSK